MFLVREIGNLPRAEDVTSTTSTVQHQCVLPPLLSCSSCVVSTPASTGFDPSAVFFIIEKDLVELGHLVLYSGEAVETNMTLVFWYYCWQLLWLITCSLPIKQTKIAPGVWVGTGGITGGNSHITLLPDP